MTYTASAADLGKVHLNETAVVASVLQNVAVILSTPRGSVPLYREFGLNWTVLDKPTPVARVMMIADVREAVERWEPRAAVVDVNFSESADGVLTPTVEVEIRND